MKSPCPYCHRTIQPSFCTRLECPQQNDAQRLEIKRRWANARVAFDAAGAFAEKGWKVRAIG